MNESTQRPIVVRSTRWHTLFGIGRTQAYHVAQSPGFPKKIRLGRQACGYVVSELEQWASEQAERE